MEDVVTKTCGRCGQPVDRRKDSWDQTGGQIVHAACPASPEMKALPVVEAVPAGRLPFLTIEETAQMLRVSDRTIRRRIRSGALPAKRLKGGQTVRIDQADVLALLEDSTGAEK